MKKAIIVLFSALAIQGFAQDKTKAQEKTATDAPKIVSKKVKNPKAVKTTSGLEYTITEKGNGKQPKKGEKVSVHYTGKFTNDSVFQSTKTMGGPYDFRVGEGNVIKGWDEVLLLLNEGDKATVKIPPALAYGEQSVGTIPPNSTLIFDMELVKILQPAIKPYEIKPQDTLRTPSGIKYCIVKKNSTAVSTSGKRVKVHYTGFLKDGKMFDSSIDKNQPLVADISKGKLFPGLDESIALLHLGEQGRFVIPSKLAFGERGGGPIPPNSDLIMDFEVIEVTEIPVATKYDTTGITAKTTATGLKYFEIKLNANSQKPTAGQKVTVNYSGYFTNGEMFESSIVNGKAIDFILGSGQVIAGWEEGIALMHVGDKFRFVIPSHIAYGEMGRAPLIPANTDLVFDVELISISDGLPTEQPHQHHEGESHDHNH